MSAKPRDPRPRRGGKRTYNTRRIKRDYAYFIAELADLFHLHPNAVRRWIKAGLGTIDDRRPVLVHGGDAIDFLDRRQAQRKQRCAIDELYCCRCRRPSKPRFNRVEIRIRNEAKLNLSGVCDACGARMNRAGSVIGIEEYRQTFIVKTLCEGRIRERSEPSVMCHLNEDKVHAALQPEK
jgi:hypothetical protein